MPFTMPDYPMLTPEQTNPFNSVLQNAFNTYGNLGQGVYRNYIQNKFLPLSLQAEAASKLAYANLMGPQFLAKLMGNPSLLANIPEGQNTELLNKLIQAGTGGGTGAALLNDPNKISEMINNNQAISGSNNQDNQTGLLNSIANLFSRKKNTTSENQNNGSMTPISNNMSNISYNTPNQTFAEKEAKYKSIVEEGQEAGKIRAKDVEELNNIVFDSQTSKTTLDNIGRILSNPLMEKMRRLPIGGKYELLAYERTGTKEEKQLVGELKTSMNKYVADDAKLFKGAFRKGEQELLSTIKMNENDTVDSMKGKWEALSYFGEMLRTRSSLTARLMEENHISKGRAMEIADKQINGEAIRKSIHYKINPSKESSNDRTNPMTTIINRKTGEIITVPLSRAKELMGK